MPRLQLSSGTKDPNEFARRNGYLSDLASRGMSDELRALASGEITIADIVAAYEDLNVKGFLDAIRRSRLPIAGEESAPLAISQASLPSPSPTPIEVVGARELLEPLWSLMMDRVIPSMGELDSATRRRYTTSIRSLQVKSQLFAADDGTCHELQDIDPVLWDELERLRMRGVDVRRARDLVAMTSSDRRTALRETDTRIAETVFNPLRTLSPASWRALAAASPLIPAQAAVEQLDRLNRDERVRLRSAAEKLACDATVNDLMRLTKADWMQYSRNWASSASDWNHMRRALSACLTDHLGSVHHPVRVAVIERIPLKKEVERLPDLPRDLFWAIVRCLPPVAVHFPVALVLLGTRISEYQRLDRKNLKPRTCVVTIPGTKTGGSIRSVSVAPSYWHYIDAAVPATRAYAWLRRMWKAACEAEGVDDITLHDLRHCHGQWAMDGGAHERSVQTTLGHTDPKMTRRYTKTVERGDVAQALENVLEASRTTPNNEDNVNDG